MTSAGTCSAKLDPGGEAAEAVCAGSAHLADCAGCRVVVDTLRKTVALSIARRLNPIFPLAPRERFLVLDSVGHPSGARGLLAQSPAASLPAARAGA
jgi:hypothetical protein